MPKTAKNLYLDPDVIERAEEYGRRHGTSLSTLVSEYLDALTRRAREPRGPLVQRLLGAGVPPERSRKKRGQRKRGIEDYRRHLDKKYGPK